MIVPLHWMKRYTPVGVSLEELCEKMVGVGFEVEEIKRPELEIDRVVVGRVTDIKRHGNSDKLWVCQIDVDGEKLQIVTGAQNVTTGALVPVALDGSTLPGGKKISAGVLRGEPSQGMLCSGVELDISKDVYPYDEGILLFNEDHPLGEDVKPIFGIYGPVVDFGVTANRPDCQCVLGLAREAAVALNVKATPPANDVRESGGGDVAQMISVDIEAPELCPRYMARIVRNVKIAPSPDWMRHSLAAAGVRPINNIVDITNYVMLEMGHPMHAFDLSAVRGGKIVVRNARHGEAIRTLDGVDRALEPSMLVITDAEGATALAGVMGGEGSQINENTRDILFECACFDTANVRVTSRALGLRSESSARFEKGVSVHTLPAALDRAAHLVELLGAGEVVRGVVDAYPQKRDVPPVKTTLSRICGHIGVDVAPDAVLRILTSLGFDVKLEGDNLTALPPPWRLDVSGFADIAEEVLRVYGYDNIRPSLTQTADPGSNTPRNRLYGVIKRQLVGMGLSEIYTESFMSPKTADRLGLAADDSRRDAIRVMNPLGEGTSLLRTTLIPSALNVLALNRSRGVADARVFEISKVFQPSGGELPVERGMLSVGMASADFFELKSVLDTLFSLHRLPDVEWTAGGERFLHPGRRAQVLCAGRVLAEAGELHPEIIERWELRGRVCAAQIDLDLLEEMKGPEVEFRPLPKHQAVDRDIALVVKEEVPVGTLIKKAQNAGKPLLESVSLFDIYRSEALGQGVKSVALALTFRSPDRTLVDAEIQQAVDAVVSECKRAFGAVLRS